MECPKCGMVVVPTSWLATYNSNGHSHLILKPEHVDDAIRQNEEHRDNAKATLTLLHEGNKVIIACHRCKTALGKNLPLGPLKSSICAFGLDKVVLWGRRFSSKDKWNQQYHLHSKIDTRSGHNLFEDANVPSNNTSSGVTDDAVKVSGGYDDLFKEEIEVDLKVPQLVFLTQESTPETFEYDSLITVNNGRIVSPLDHQISAYVEALLNNLLLVMPTGTGKTVVAALVLAKMAKLNPFHVGLLVVDRVPLVFQHRDFIKDVTGLRVVASCGENFVERHRDLILEKQCDVFVVTAGLFVDRDFVNLLHRFHTVVLDECHHATGNHAYSKIVSKLRMMSNGPRFLGLTASPYESKEVVGLDFKFSVFMDTLPRNTLVFLPQGSYASSNNIHEDVIVLAQDPGQISLIARLLDYSSSVLRGLSDNLVDSFLKSAGLQASTYSSSLSDLQLKQRLSHLRRALGHDKDNVRQLDVTTTLLSLIDVVKDCGTQFGRETLDQLKDCLPSEKLSYGVYFDLSPKLKQLLSILEKLDKDDRVIIFVKMKSTAKVLNDYLKQKLGKHVNPKMIVGKTGCLGMDWDGDYGQQRAIEAFNSGSCKILTATSVIEEGLDVASCNTVVRFDPSVSLIQLLQSKGRARFKQSKMITLMYKDDLSRYGQVKMRQNLMQTVLGSEKLSLTSASASIISSLISNKKSIALIPTTRRDCGFNGAREKFQFLIFASIDGKGVLGSNLILELLRERLETVKDFNLIAIDEEGKAEEYAFNLFSPQSLVFRVTMESSLRKELKKHFLRNFSFKVPKVSLLFQFTCEIAADNTTSDGFLSKTSYDTQSRLFFGHLNFIGNSESAQSKKENEEVKGLTFIPETKEMFIKRIVFTNDSLNITLKDSNEFEVLRSSTLGFAFALEDKELSNSVYQFALPIQCPPPIMGSSNCIVVVHTTDLSHMLDRCQLKLFHVIHRCSPERSQTRGYERNELTQFLRDLRFDTLALHHMNAFCSTSNLFDRLVEHIEDLNDEKSVKNMCIAVRFFHRSNTPLPYMCDVLPRIKNVYEAYNTGFTDELVLQNSKQLSLLKRVVITPSRLQCCLRVVVTKNRLFDLFPDDDFVLIDFKDFLSTPGKVTEIIRCGVHIMENDSVYHFVASSRNQLSGNSGFFVRSDEQRVKEMRACIIDDYSLRSVAKYVTSVGLFCTSVVKIADVSPTNISFADDIKARNHSLLTDGCGKVRRSFLTSLSHFSNDNELDLPSAIQIRLGGCKGVLAVVPDSYIPDQTDIMMHYSMKKFESNHTTLGLVKKANYMKLEMNREIINLLTSLETYYGRLCVKSEYEPSSRIRDLQSQTISKLLRRFESSEEAVALLKRFINEQDKGKVKTWIKSVEVNNEPFFKNLLVATYLRDVHYLSNKAWIPVPDGCRLMGIYDFTGTLRDNEVYCCIQGPEDSSRRVIKKTILIYRNPCLHPGDVRVVNAVESSLLFSMNIKNVLVFPAHPSCAVSLPENCSGGDLDGDEYAVIWDDMLIPPTAALFPVCNYGALASHEDTTLVKDKSRSVNDQHLIGVYFARNTSSSLGQVANMHLALCDHLDFGACNPIAIKVANAQSIAVDFPKTGIEPKVPLEAKDLVYSKGYPDFMKKSKGYESKNLMGELYRDAASYAVITERVFSINPGQGGSNEILQLIDNDLVLEGREDFSIDAAQTYEEYCLDVRSLLSLFDETREEFLFLYFHDPRNTNSRESLNRFNPRMQGCVEVLRNKYRRRFDEGVDFDNRLNKASAYYCVVYDARSSVLAQGLPLFLSFPWVCAMDELMTIKKDNRNINLKSVKKGSKEKSEGTNVEKIGLSILNLFNRESVMMDSAIEERLKLVRKLELSLEKNKVEIFVFGSTALLLCNDSSDVDVHVAPSSSTSSSSSFFLQSRVLPILSKLSEEVIALTENKRLPLITFTSSSSLKCDLTPRKNGLLKTRLIQSMLDASPSFYLFMFAIVKWARMVGIVRGDSSDQIGSLATAEFYALVFLVMQGHPLVPAIDALAKDNFDECKCDRVAEMWLRMRDSLARDEMRSSLCIQSGCLILNFFERALQMIDAHKDDKAFIYQWPLSATSTSDEFLVEFRPTLMNALKANLDRSRHSLLLNECFDSVLQCCNTKQMPYVRLLPLSLQSMLEQDKLYFEEKLRRQCGIEKLSIINDNGDFIVNTKATSHQLGVLKREIYLWSNNRFMASKKNVRNRACRYFIEDSGLVLLCGGDDESTLRFEDYFGHCNIRHQGKPLAKVDVVRRGALKSVEHFWCQDFKARLASALARQLDKVSNNGVINKNSLQFLNSLKLSIKPGQFYVAEPKRFLPDHQVTVTVGELQEGMSKSRATRRAYKRKEFEMTKTNNDATVSLKNNYDSNNVKQTKGKVTKWVERGKKKSKSLSSSFVSDIKDMLNDECGVRFWDNVLKEVGFVEAANESSTGDTWNLHINASQSYEINLLLDANYYLQRITERSVNWVHCTLLMAGNDDHRIDNRQDFRLTLRTKEPIAVDSQLFEFVFGSNKWPNQPLMYEANKGSRKWTGATTKMAQDSTILIRYRREHAKYVLESTSAVIVEERQFDCNLRALHSSVTVHLSFDTESLKNLAISNEHHRMCNTVAHRVTQVLRKFSASLERNIVLQKT